MDYDLKSQVLSQAQLSLVRLPKLHCFNHPLLKEKTSVRQQQSLGSVIKMAIRLAVLKSSGINSGCALSFMRLAHVAALPEPMNTIISSPIVSPPLVLPDISEGKNSSGFGFPSFSFGASMELMAVPKKKVNNFSFPFCVN